MRLTFAKLIFLLCSGVSIALSSTCTANIRDCVREECKSCSEDNHHAFLAPRLFIPRGPAGPKGERGSRGDVGAPGEKGLMGPQVKGVQGDKGDKGERGWRGRPGVAGPPGLKGDRGGRGERGFGIKGIKGERGRSSSSRGPKGEKGAPVDMSAIEKLIDEKIKAVLGSSSTTMTSSQSTVKKPPASYSNCNGVSLGSAKSRNKTGGVFDIVIPEIGKKEVYCDTTTDGGNWIVFQRRMDGSQNFDRSWNDYVNGFGKPNGEHWLGLEAIHQFTRKGNAELRIEMSANIGSEGSRAHYYAKYSNFEVGSASDEYRLSVSGYSGNASDALANPPYDNVGLVSNGQQFSTRDRDNDEWITNSCAMTSGGGWWFKACTYSNLNHRYFASWYNHDKASWIYAEFTEMKFRRN